MSQVTARCPRCNDTGWISFDVRTDYLAGFQTICRSCNQRGYVDIPVAPSLGIIAENIEKAMIEKYFDQYPNDPRLAAAVESMLTLSLRAEDV